MRIIKEGPGWGKEKICTGDGNGGGGCGSTLLVGVGDFYQTLCEHYDGSTDYFVTFTCPVCGVETDMKEDEIPSGIGQIIPKSKKEWLEKNNNVDG